jgi:hypothetical protein
MVPISTYRVRTTSQEVVHRTGHIREYFHSVESRLVQDPGLVIVPDEYVAARQNQQKRTADLSGVRFQRLEERTH